MTSPVGRNRNRTRILYRSREEAKQATGHFSVSSIEMTAALTKRIHAYVQAEALETWLAPNRSKTAWNHYTLKFRLMVYRDPSAPYGYLDFPGALGKLKSALAHDYEVKAGRARPYVSFGLQEDNDKKVQRYEDLLKRTPELEQLYFWICRKYPQDLVSVRLSTDPPTGIAAALIEMEKGGAETAPREPFPF